MTNWIAFLVIALSASTVAAQGTDGPFNFDFQELAPGVWAGVRADSPRLPVMGNTTFVITNEGVIVFDGGGAPAMAEQIIAKVRSLTDQQVTHVVISHWHGDHNFGVYRFAQEYPAVKFISHEFTNAVFHSTRIAYIDEAATFIERNKERFEGIVATGLDPDGNEVSQVKRRRAARILQDAAQIESEAKRARVTPADITFTDRYAINSGGRTIELMHLGHANTAGDIVMWLPQERIVAAGDIVVLPSPYAFNVPPRPWVATLQALNKLDYRILVPGHGEIQTDSTYVDLLIDTVSDIADQRDTLLAAGRSPEETQALLDFSEFEDRFTHGDAYIKNFYDAYFEEPLRAAALKALTGEPMVQIDPPESVPMDSDRWQIDATQSEVVDYLGQRALKIRGGTALLEDLDLTNAMVEFDIAAGKERGFAGLAFRVQDDANYEHFYIRPHQTGQPDANQYNPVFNGVSGWQLYHGEGYGAAVDYRADAWMHVKVIYAGPHARVYIDSAEPVLQVGALKRDVTGGAIGVNSSGFSTVYFANVKVTALPDAYAIPAPAIEAPVAPPGSIMSWEVSGVFDGASLDGANQLPRNIDQDQSWTTLTAEATGIANLARVQGLAKGKDTVFVRFPISSDRKATKQLTFGYSDAARVYVNGALVYSGNNQYQSRDYRFLGTIGLFDSVPVQLRRGENEIRIAVTEKFGGWGVAATISD